MNPSTDGARPAPATAGRLRREPSDHQADHPARNAEPLVKARF